MVSVGVKGLQYVLEIKSELGHYTLSDTFFSSRDVFFEIHVMRSMHPGFRGRARTNVILVYTLRPEPSLI